MSGNANRDDRFRAAVPEHEEPYWRKLFDAESVERLHFRATIELLDGRRYYLSRENLNGVPLWRTPAQFLYLVDPMRDFLDQAVMPKHVDEFVAMGKQLTPAYFTSFDPNLDNDGPRRAILVDFKWDDRPDWLPFPWLRMREGSVQRLYTEGGWEFVGYWLSQPPIAEYAPWNPRPVRR